MQPSPDSQRTPATARQCRSTLRALLFSMLLSSTVAAAPTDRQGDLLLNRALGLLQRGNYQQGIEQLQASLSVFQASGNRQRQCVVRQNIGIAHMKLQQWPAAADALQSAVGCADTMTPAAERYLLLKLGEARFAAGDSSGASSAFHDLLTAALRARDSGDELIGLYQLGKVQFQAGQYRAAAERWEKMLARAIEVNNLSAQGSALFNLGELYYASGDHVRAISSLNRAIELAEATGVRAQQAAASCKLGAVLFSLHALARALNAFESCGQLAGDSGNYIDRLQALNGAGGALYRMHDNAAAADKYRAAVVLATEHGDSVRRRQARSNLGLALAAQGNLQQAAALVREDLASTPQDGAFRSRNWLNLGTILERQGLQDKAMTAYRNAVENAAQADYARGEILARIQLGVLLSRQGKFTGAVTSLEPVLPLLEAELAGTATDDLLQLGVLDAQQDAYLCLQYALTRLGRHADALAIAERGRARAFANMLRRHSQSRDANPLTGAQLLHALQQQPLTRIAYTLLPTYLLSVDRVEKPVAGGLLLIWLLSTDGTLHFREAELTADSFELVTDARLQLGASARSPGTAQPPSLDSLRQLERLLIAPIASLLPPGKDEPLLVVPHGPLFLLPFALLGEGTALLDRYNLQYAPSLTVSLAASTAAVAADKPLVAGNPLMPTASLAALPGAEQEAREVAQLLGTRALLGAAASESQVVRRLPHSSIVHLSTHGILGTLDDAPAGSPPGILALAPGDDSDGWLAATEIIDIPMRAELVVLSACDTGKGRLGGDGVAGLSRAFLAAGARQVVVSLWKVPDRQTRELMVEFHRFYHNSGSAAAALRRAQLKMRAKYPDPYYWAAFIAVGSAIP